jgi:hypothetical protein
MNGSDLGIGIGMEASVDHGGESPPDFGDTPPYEQGNEWSAPDASLSHSATSGHGDNEEWVETLIDIETIVKD